MNETTFTRADLLAAQLDYEIDVMDAFAAQCSDAAVLADTRRRGSWAHGHVTGAIHLPVTDVDNFGAATLEAEVPLIVYGWGPGCNGATRTADALLRRGVDVREMIGGIEYWIRNGLPVTGLASSPLAWTAVNRPMATVAANETVDLTQSPDPLVRAEG